MSRFVRRGRHGLVWGDYLQACRHRLAAAEPVLNVDRVVLAVRAPQSQEDRRPAADPESLLLEWLREQQLAIADVVVLTLTLRHAVQEHPVGRLGTARERHAPA